MHVLPGLGPAASSTSSVPPSRAHRSAAAFAVLAALLPCLAAAETKPLDLRWRWVYAPTNFQSDKSVDSLIALMERAKKADYSGMVVIDGKFGKITGRGKGYYDNLTLAKEAADRIGIELIPAVGHYMGMNDRNLAEGIAVEDCVFVAKDGKAVVEGQENLLPGGDLDKPWTRVPAGFDWVDKPGARSFCDAEVKRSGAASLRMDNFASGGPKGTLVRLVKQLKVEPRKQYVLEMWVRTRGASPATGVHPSIFAIKDNRALLHPAFSVAPTREWTPLRVVFNSLEYDEIRAYLAARLKEGTVWIDDVSISQTAGVNLLRRKGCPVRVTSDDGRKVYVEGRDFERWTDPIVGTNARVGRIDHWHAPPPIVLTKSSRIRDGQRLKVSFYHTLRMGRRGPGACLRHEAFFDHLEELVRALQKHLSPRKYHLMHNSELRLAGQCALCRRKGELTGQVLAENARRSSAVVRRVCPGAVVTVWNDMFDPNHNARPRYALCGNSMERSWEGLSSICVINWNAAKKKESLTFFSKRGNRQIISCNEAGGVGSLKKWLEAARNVKGVVGVMYTTWRGDYGKLEAFSEVLKAHAGRGKRQGAFGTERR